MNEFCSYAEWIFIIDVDFEYELLNYQYSVDM